MLFTFGNVSDLRNLVLERRVNPLPLKWTVQNISIQNLRHNAHGIPTLLCRGTDKRSLIYVSRIIMDISETYDFLPSPVPFRDEFAFSYHVIWIFVVFIKHSICPFHAQAILWLECLGSAFLDNCWQPFLLFTLIVEPPALFQ